MTIYYNENLGFLPVSNFVTLHNYDPFDTIYEYIINSGCRDIILFEFQGEEKKLQWLIPRLLSENYFVSLFTDIKYIPENIIYSRLICSIKYEDITLYRKVVETNLNLLKEHDALFINELDLNLFNRILHILNTSPEIFFNSKIEDIILKYKRYTYFKLDKTIKILGVK